MPQLIRPRRPLSPHCPSLPSARPRDILSIIIFLQKVSLLIIEVTQCKEKTKQKTTTTKILKSPYTKRIACFTSRKFLAFESGNHLHILRNYCLEESIGHGWGGGEGGEVGGMWARATLTVPGRMSPAGQRSGPPSHSPPVAAQLDHSLGTAW